MVCPSNSSFRSAWAAALAALAPVLPQVRDMDECRAFQPDVDECALHARQHADHTAQVNIAYMAALDAALDMQFLHRSLLDQRDAGLERGDIDQDVFAHCGGSGHGAVVSIELGGRLTRRIVNVPPGQASRDGAFSLTKLGAGGTEWWLGAGVRILFAQRARWRERREGRGETGRPDSRSSEKGVGKGTSEKGRRRCGRVTVAGVRLNQVVLCCRSEDRADRFVLIRVP